MEVSSRRKEEIEKFVTNASLIIVEYAEQEIKKRGLDPNKILKIEAGDHLDEKPRPIIFWVKVFERHPVEIPLEPTGEKIKLFEDIRNLGYCWPLHIRVTF